MRETRLMNGFAEKILVLGKRGHLGPKSFITLDPLKSFFLFFKKIVFAH